MKKLSADSQHTKLIAAASAFVWTIAIVTSAGAAQLQEARVTQVVNDVKLLLEQAAPRPAALTDLIRRGTAVRTGTQSRSELTFADLTITRLGANTIFSFKEGTREMNLVDGAILFQVPKGSGGATIRTVGVTATITGTTGIGEFHPATTSHPLSSKWLCLEGKIVLHLPNGQSVELGPGQMVTTDGKSYSQVMDFDITRLVTTSLFFIGFDRPLPSLDLIMAAAQNQLTGGLLVTNPLDPIRIVDVISQVTVAEETPVGPSPSVSPTGSPTASPTVTVTPPQSPTPSKFGTPSVISSPVPYLITSGTIIKTDPLITTNGVTDYGKIYRGPLHDGAFSLWAFGSTSAFDTALRIDDFFSGAQNRVPIAAFKFQSLSLTGDPTIDLSNNGVTKLALIGVDGITSGPPGGTLTFTGLDLLALATVNGSINLTSDVSFQNLSGLAMYARGAGSDLTINSPISNIGILGLAAEDSIHLTNPGTMSVGEFDAITGGGNLTLQIGGSLLLNSAVRLDATVLPGATVASGANLTLNVTGDYTNNSATEFSRLAITNQGHIGTGGNIAVDIGGDLTATGPGSATDFPAPGDVELLVQNTNAQIDNGGNLNLTVGGNIHVNGLTLYVQNYDQTMNPAGHIGTGGNIDVEIAGNVTSNSYVDVFLNNRGGGMIDSGGNLTFNIGGALNIGDADGDGFSAEFVVSTRYDDIGGNTTTSTIGSDVSLYLHAANINMAGGLFGSGISNRGGSTIDGDATAIWNVTGDVTIQGTANLGQGAAGASWFILNDIPPDHQLTTPSGGTIHGNATLTLNIGGDLTIAGDGSIDIANHRNFQEPGSTGGTIDSDATLNITAANFSVGGQLDIDILNRNNGSGSGTGGSIGGDAAINLNLSGNLTTPGSDPNSLGTPGLASIGIFNEGFVAGSPAGFIGGNASIAVSATNISTANNLEVQIANQGGGHIGGSAAINFNLDADLNSHGDANFTINNSNGGMIGGAVNVAVNIGNNVTVTGSNGISLNILNSSSHIVTGANVLYSVGGTTSTTGLTEYIDNTNGGVIDNGGNITLNTVGPVMLDGGLDLEMDNFNGGTINNGANVTAHFVGDVTATVGQFHSLNWNVLNGSGFFNPTATGGTIGTGGDINVTFDGDASTTGTSTTGSISAQIQNGNGGSIGTGGNISVTVGGDLTAGPLFFMTENQGGHIGTGGNMTLQVAGDITTQGDANFQIFNNDNGSGAGTIDLSATINVTAANISSGGSLFDNIFNYSGGSIGENARINLAVGGNLTTAQGGTLDLSILNNDGGHIGGDASILASINGNVNTTDLNIGIQDYNGGVIMGGGNVVLNVGGSLTVAENTHPLFLFINTFNGGSINNGGNILASVGGDLSTGTISSGIQNQDGGTINTGGNFSLTVGGNLTTAQNTDAAFFINNFNGGFIGNGGSISVSIGGNISAGRALGFTISNETNGIISSDAMMNVAGNNISVVDSLNTFLVNHQGSIGGNAAINFLAPAGIDAGNGAFFAIVNEDNGGTTVGGTIGGDALVHVTADHLSTEALAPSDFNLFGTIHNRGGTIGGNCDVMFDIAGAITTEGRANFDILNFDDGGVNGGGIIGGNAVVSVSANSLTTTTTQSDAGLSISNGSLGSIDGSAIISLNLAGDLTAQGNANFAIGNQDQGSGGGTIGSDATIDVAAASISNQGNLFLTIFNQLGSIGGDAAIRLSLSGDIVSQHDANFWIWNFGVGPPAGTINGDALINVAAVNLTAANGGILTGQILNQNVGLIGGNATMDFDFSGDINAGGVDLIIDNIGGMIGQDARISVTATNISVGGNLDVTIDNSADGGTIGGSANLTFNLTGNLAAQGEANFQILNNDAGQIGGNGNISVTTGGDLTANSIFAFINNRNGGAIGSAANMSFNIGGALSTTGDALFVISNRNDGSGGGTIGSSVNLTLSAASVSGGGNLLTDVSTNQGGHIMGSVHNTVDAAGLLSGGTLDFEIENAGFDTGGGFEPGGTIDADAILSVTASDISTTSDYFNEIIANDGGGHIGGNATVSVVASSMDVATNAFFNILNGQNGAGTPTGSIGGNAAIDVAAATLSIGGNLDSGIDNSGGSISGMAQIIFNLAGNLTTQGDALFVIDNSFDGEVTSGTIGSDATINISANNISTGGSLSAFINNSINPGDGFIGGTIGGDATIDVTANNITANSLLAQIDNTGGSIGASTEGGATINMNVSGTANVTNDATVAIYGSDGAVGGAAININGGSYNVGGTFLSYIDGNGTIAFNNINAHADVLKAGVFGTDGVLNVGGGILEANTTLKLYASGSNGVLNFLNSVTLRGSALTKILAANTINIFDNVRVTIGGSTPADVYTNHANYTGFGGNGTRTGTFAGAGAHDPQPLASAPPFGPASPVKLTTGGNIPSATAVPPQSAPGRTPAPGGNITTRTRIPPTLPSNVLTNGKIADVRRASNVIHVSNSDELLSLLDGAAPGPGGKITIPPAKSASNARNSNRTNVPGRVNTGSRVNVDRRAMDMRTASSSVIRHSPQ